MTALDWETIDLGPLEEPELWDLLVAAQIHVNKIAHSVWSQSEKLKISTGYFSIKEMVDAPSNEMPRRIKLNYFRSKVQALREQADYLTSQCAPQNQSSPIFLRKIIFQATISGAALHIMQQFSFWSSERNSRPFSTGGITSNSTATCFPSREPFPSRESISFHWSPSQNATRTHFGANQNEIRIKQVAPWQNFLHQIFPSNGLLPCGGMQLCGQPFPSTDNHYHFHLPAQAHPCWIEARHGIGCPVPALPWPGNIESLWTAGEAFVSPCSAPVRTAELVPPSSIPSTLPQ